MTQKSLSNLEFLESSSGQSSSDRSGIESVQILLSQPKAKSGAVKELDIAALRGKGQSSVMRLAADQGEVGVF